MEVSWCTREGMRANYNCIIAQHPVVKHSMDPKWVPAPVVASPGDLAERRIARNRARVSRFMRQASMSWLLSMGLIAALAPPSDSGEAVTILQISFAGAVAGWGIAFCLFQAGRGTFWR